MPQMSPINWIILFITFLMIFVLLISKIYPLTKTSLNSVSNFSTPNFSTNWLW